MGKKSKSRAAPSPPWDKSGARARVPEKQRQVWNELRWLLPAIILGFLIYLNTLHGAFVYDDQIQISRNTFIQDGSQTWRALTSDVWKFQTGDQTNSNYWRPTFVLWLIFNFQCFGFNVIGWHLTNILLHLIAIVLAFVVVRQFEVPIPTALVSH